MYKRQKGILPFLTNSFGLTFLGIMFFVLLRISADVVAQNRAAQSSYTAVDFYIDVGGSLLLGAFYLSPLWLIGCFLLSTFPLIRLVPEGIRYRIANRQKLLLWSEIENIIEFRNGFVALTISRKGSVVFNGLYFNQLCGICSAKIV